MVTEELIRAVRNRLHYSYTPEQICADLSEETKEDLFLAWTAARILNEIEEKDNEYLEYQVFEVQKALKGS